MLFQAPPQPDFTDVTNVCWDLGIVMRQRMCVALASVLSALTVDGEQTGQQS